MVSIKRLKDAEFRKPTKTLSGVTPLAVMLKPRACKNTCLYCPSLNAPQSYTPKSPAVMRATRLGYDSFKQVKARLRAFKVMKHPVDKIELIIMGGTFLDYLVDYQREFVKGCYDALNCKMSKDLDGAIKLNEKAKHRCVALCIETRPDVCGEREIKLMRGYGATRCELGVQILDDKIYERIKRGHKVEDVIMATKKLKNAGLKVGYHIMPNLPGSDAKHDLKMFKKVFKNKRFRPDQLKIYPTQVLKGAELEEVYRKGGYGIYSDEKLKKLLIRMLKIVPEYCRVMRVMREIHPDYIIAGTTKIDLRNVLDAKLGQTKEIRSREVGLVSRGKNVDGRVKLKVKKYDASDGKEWFISFVNSDNVLFGLLRLRLCDKPFLHKHRAIIREVHVYGKQARIGKSGNPQHIGLGKKMIEKAEEIARKYSDGLDVIAGVGVRKYFRKLGYELEGEYMSKEFKVYEQRV